VTRPAWIGAAAMAVLALLVVDNVIRFAIAEREESCTYLPCVRPRSLEANARESSHGMVSGPFALFHALRTRLDGATVQLPASLAEDAWHLERVARVRVEPVEAPRVPSPEQVARWRASSPERHMWTRTRRTGRKVPHPVDVVFGAPDAVYVVADDGAQLYLVPEAAW
jgi:hypothetical protein